MPIRPEWPEVLPDSIDLLGGVRVLTNDALSLFGAYRGKPSVRSRIEELPIGGRLTMYIHEVDRWVFVERIEGVQ